MDRSTFVRKKSGLGCPWLPLPWEVSWLSENLRISHHIGPNTSAASWYVLWAILMLLPPLGRWPMPWSVSLQGVQPNLTLKRAITNIQTKHLCSTRWSSKSDIYSGVMSINPNQQMAEISFALLPGANSVFAHDCIVMEHDSKHPLAFLGSEITDTPKIKFITSSRHELCECINT